jgi:predicted RNase H-like nuclease (RuvC/YqgF family)
LDYAIMNIGTSVEDLVSQKRKLDNERESDKFVQELRTHRQNKDHMIETIHTEMRQMSSRLKTLAEENKELRETVKELKNSLRVQQLRYDQAREESFINTVIADDSDPPPFDQ